MDLVSYCGFDNVVVGNGKSLKITHIGMDHIGNKSCDIPLQNVLVVPQIKKNLLSISRLTKDYPHYLMFDGFSFLLRISRLTRC